MQESLALTRLLNQLFGPMVAAAMRVVGLHPAHPATPIDNTFALEFLVVFGLIVFFLIVRLTLSVEKPNPAQQVAEMIHEFTGSQAESVIGHGYERFQAFVTCVGLFIVLNNLIGLLIGFPGVETPTGNPSVPLGIAVLTFLYYNYHGLRVHGPIGYAKQFAGPIWWMLSLTIRLYANMLASDMLTLAFFSLIPLLVPTAFLGLHFAVALIQAYVFMLLSIIYLGLAVSEEH